MNISGYGVAYNYSGYNSSANKAKTSSASAIILDEKPKTESKKSSNANNVYDPLEDMATTGSVSLPSWIYTKTELTRSEEEIIKDIIEVAKRHAEQGTFQDEGDDEFNSLVKEWTSPVSPDREEILKRTMKEIYDKKDLIPKKSGGKEEDKNFDMINTLLQALKTDKEKVDKIESSSNGGARNRVIGTVYNMEGDNYYACVEDGKLKGALIRDDSGKYVMAFDTLNSSGKLSLSQSWTEEEGIRRAKLLEVYNETYKSVSDSKGLVSGNAFDAVG
jgi:hypothetical protein